MTKEERFQLYISEYKISSEPRAFKNEYQKPLGSIFWLCNKKYVTTTIITPKMPIASTVKLLIL
jgi:hypothetical protein